MFAPLGLATLLAIFGAAAAVIWVAGVKLAETTDILSRRLGFGEALGGVVLLAIATNLPEIAIVVSASVAGNVGVAVGNILGGNAFLPVLFLLATVISGKAVLPQAGHADIYLAGLGILLTSVYLAGLVFRPKRLILGMGIDSVAVLILYALGTAGLFLVATR